VQPEAELGFVTIRSRITPGLQPGGFIAVIHQPHDEVLITCALKLIQWVLAHAGEAAVIAMYDGDDGELVRVGSLGCSVVGMEEGSWN
jgi:hypothetical protein